MSVVCEIASFNLGENEADQVLVTDIFKPPLPPGSMLVSEAVGSRLLYFFEVVPWRASNLTLNLGGKGQKGCLIMSANRLRKNITPIFFV